MISYRPLQKTLADRNMTFDDLLLKMNTKSDSLKRTMNRRQYITTEDVMNICNTLNCRVSDVCSFMLGDQNILVPEKHDVIWCVLKWDRIEELMDKKHLSNASISRQLERSSNFFLLAHNNQRNLKKIDVENLCGILECNERDIVKKEFMR